MYTICCGGANPLYENSYSCYDKHETLSLETALAGRNDVKYAKKDGIDLATQTLEAFRERTFGVRLAHRVRSYHGVSSADVLEFVTTKLPSYYDYETRLKLYKNRKAEAHVRIQILGRIGLSRQLKRYNPLDVSLSIKSEK